MGRCLLATAAAILLVAAVSCGGSRPEPQAHPAVPKATTAVRPLGITLLTPRRPRALVVLVHGGGFRSGNRHQMDGWAHLLSGDGYATATIDYRLEGPQEHDKERALARAAQDTLAALDRLQRNAALAKLPVVLWGYSAGALTVLRVGAQNPARVRALVSLSGYERPSEITQGHPPMLLFNGKADTAEPVALADRTCSAARAVSVRCDQVVYPGATHDLARARERDIHRRAHRWLARILGA